VGRKRDITSGVIVVRTAHGATVFVRILSFAHSHAKFFVIWLIAPEN
jgi:hypothetical protein